VEGKVFDPTTDHFLEIRALPEIDLITESLENPVLIRHRERQVPAILKGVSDNFNQLVPIQSVLFDGEFKLQDEINSYATLGIGVANTLGVGANFVFPVEICAPKRDAKVNLSNPMAALNREYAYVCSVFMINQPVYDDNYLLVPIKLARALFNYETEAGAWEIKLKAGTNTATVQKKIRQILGDAYQVKDRYEQQESAFKMISIEKWVTFLMLCFILLIAAFNVIGSLSMLMVDKQKDIAMLRHLGASHRLISNIFLLEGWMISVVGVLVGILVGVLLCLGQQTFGWIALGHNGNFTVDAYPVKIEINDLLITLIAVLVIGFLSVSYPVHYLLKKTKSS
jgi:ABC-type lipoprotein release transport system permease subunit